MGILVAWELIENTLFIAMGMKFEGRADSSGNMTTDIIIGMVGALINWLAAYEIEEHDEKGIWIYYIGGVIAFAIWILVFVVLRYLTL